MLRPAFPTLLIVLAAFAGCLSAAPEEENVAPAAFETGSALLKELAAAAPATPPTTHAWWVAPVTATPDGGLLGFWLDLPPNASVPSAYSDRMADDMNVFAFEVAPIVPEGVELTAFGVLGFSRDDDGKLVPSGGMLSVEETVLETVAVVTTVQTIPVWTAPTFVAVEDSGDGRVPFILFARSDRPAEVGLAIRLLDHDPRHEDSESEPAESWSAFRAARGDATPTAILGTAGSGFAFKDYLSLRIATTGITFLYEIYRGDLNLDHFRSELRGISGARTSVATTNVFPQGYAMTQAVYLGWGTGATEWVGHIDARESYVGGSGRFVEAWTAPFPADGYVTLLDASDGEGNIEFAFDVHHVGVPRGLQVYSAGMLELGTTVATLLGETPGLPSLVDSRSDGPLVGFDLTPTKMPDGAWRMLPEPVAQALARAATVGNAS